MNLIQALLHEFSCRWILRKLARIRKRLDGATEMIVSMSRALGPLQETVDSTRAELDSFVAKWNEVLREKQ